jgi:hypothetical protein
MKNTSQPKRQEKPTTTKYFIMHKFVITKTSTIFFVLATKFLSKKSILTNLFTYTIQILSMQFFML